MSVSTATPDQHTVVATVTVDADPVTVFAAFTDSAVLVQWWWPERFQTDIGTDPVSGGAFHLRSEVVGMGVSGRYLEVEEPTRLVLTWQWDGEPETSEVTIELRPVGPVGCEVVVTHSANPDPATRDSHGAGWISCLGRLVERYAGASTG